MNKHLENRMSMLYTVRQVCEKHSGAFGSLPPFVNAFGELKVNISATENAIRTQEQSLLGVALDKRTKRTAMLSSALAVANAAFAYAEDTGDLALRERMSWSFSTSNKGRDAVIGQRCQGIHDDATANLPDLPDYGVTAVDLTALRSDIDAYVATIGSPRSALTVRKGATAEITALVKDSLKILNNRMDKLMSEFKESKPNFYQEYFDARIIVDSGARTQERPDELAPAA